MTRAAMGNGPRADPAAGWELARGLLHGFENRATSTRAGPEGSPPEERVLPVAEPLARLLPAGGLRRGSTVAVPGGPGSTSLLLALLAEASAGGAWVGVVGRPELGLVAAAEAGLRLDRLALVPRPGADLLAVTSALLDGLDVVAVAGAERAGIRAADRQRLAARARQRGAVLVALGRWPGADLELSCADARWHGLGARELGGLRAAALPRAAGAAARAGGGPRRARRPAAAARPRWWGRGRGWGPGSGGRATARVAG